MESQSLPKEFRAAAFIVVGLAIVACCIFILSVLVYADAVEVWEDTARQTQELYNFSSSCYQQHYISELSNDPYFSVRAQNLNSGGEWNYSTS